MFWSTLTPLYKGIATAVAIVLLVAIFFIGKCSYDRSVINKHEQQVQQQAQSANNQAESERAQDAATTNQNEQELHNAIAAQPDQPISPSSHALACARLHAAGRNPAACR